MKRITQISSLKIGMYFWYFYWILPDLRNVFFLFYCQTEILLLFLFTFCEFFIFDILLEKKIRINTVNNRDIWEKNFSGIFSKHQKNILEKCKNKKEKKIKNVIQFFVIQCKTKLQSLPFDLSFNKCYTLHKSP